MNNNNRCYGQSVRGVGGKHRYVRIMGYRITIERLRKELELAYYMARRHKGKKGYVKDFDKDLHENLDALAVALYERRYEPQPSFCFIVHEPKIREIFAARFVDRIVHHLYFNMVSAIFERLFIEDSYSCREGKGSHYGVHRLYGHIRKASRNYTREVYILQLDIKGHFINIDRKKILSITERIFGRAAGHAGRYTDLGFVRYLNRVIVMNDPADDCIIKSPPDAWNKLPDSKSLFKARNCCGLPIGNLTSQLLSNVYMNELDQYAKRVLHCRHYGRYVDDIYVVSEDKEWLKYVAGRIRSFLSQNVALELNQGKTRITSSKVGVRFLGYFVREHRIYLCNRTMKRVERRISEQGVSAETVNSYLGMFRHCRSYRLRKQLLYKAGHLREKGFFSSDYTKYTTYDNLKLS